MASKKFFTRGQIARVAKELYREHSDESNYHNAVDLSRTHLNYSMNGLNRKTFLEQLDLRCMEVMQGRKMQKQTNVIVSWVFTCPEPLRGNAEKEQQYFDTCVEFIEDRYGKENIIDAVVHYDETNPHMTVYFVPVGKSRKTGKETISSASVVNLKDLKTFHPDFEKRLFEVFRIHGLGQNGNGKDLDLDDYKELKEREKEVAERENKVAKQEKELASKLAGLDKELAEKKSELDRAYQRRVLDLRQQFQNKVDAEVDSQLADRKSKLDDREEEVSKRESAVTEAENTLKSKIRAEYDVLKDIPEREAKQCWNYCKRHYADTASEVVEAVRGLNKTLSGGNIDLATRRNERSLER